MLCFVCIVIVVLDVCVVNSLCYVMFVLLSLYLCSCVAFWFDLLANGLVCLVCGLWCLVGVRYGLFVVCVARVVCCVLCVV